MALFTQTTLTRIRAFTLPEGAQLVEASSFPTTTVRQGDTLTERIVLTLHEHTVQILRYDGDDRQVLVYIDRAARRMPMDRVHDYIVSNT